MPETSWPNPPGLLGQRVRLRPISSADYSWLYPLALSEAVGFRWRFRGSTPSPERFVEGLWRNVQVQFAIEVLDDHRPIGLVQAYGAELRSGYAYLSVVVDPESARRGWPLEGVELFVDYLFVFYGLRKLYVETLDFNLKQYESALGSIMVEEGRLRGHELHMGQFVDLVMLAMYPEDWWRRARRFNPRPDLAPQAVDD